MQPCVSPVATAISGASSSPDRPAAPNAPALSRPVADLPGEQRLRRIVRHQPADQKGAARGGGVDRRAQHIGAARIAVDQRQGRRDGLDPAGMHVAADRRPGRRSRRTGGSCRAAGRRAAGRRPGGHGLSFPAAQTPSPTPPTQAAVPVASASSRTSCGKAEPAGSLTYSTPSVGALSFGQLAAQARGEGRGIALGEGGGETGAHDRLSEQLGDIRRDALDDQRPRRARSGGGRPAD